MEIHKNGESQDSQPSSSPYVVSPRAISTTLAYAPTQAMVFPPAYNGLSYSPGYALCLPQTDQQCTQFKPF